MSRYVRVSLGEDSPHPTEAHDAPAPAESAPAGGPIRSALNFARGMLSSAASSAVAPAPSATPVPPPPPKVVSSSSAARPAPRPVPRRAPIVTRDSPKSDAASSPRRTSAGHTLLIGAAALVAGGVLVWLVSRRPVVERIYR